MAELGVPLFWKHPYTVLYTGVYLYHHWSWRFKAQPPKNAQAVDPLSPDSISQTDIHRTWPIYAHLNKCNITCIYWLWRYAVHIYIYVRVLRSYCVWACFSFWWNVKALNVASLVGIWYHLLIASMRYSRQCSRGLDGSCASSKPQT